MKKLLLLFVFTCAFLVYSSAQTKKIANESHNGKKYELKIDGDGNFGETYPPPKSIDPYLAEMHHYADSIRAADSIKNASLRMDSIRKSDSINQVKKTSAPKKKSSKRKARGISASADVERSKKVMMKP